MTHRAVFLGALLLVTTTAARTTPPLAPLAALEKQGARVSALVVDLADGKALAALNPDKALVPASTSKLYVTAAALARWGPGHRFRTRFLGTAPVIKGTVQGDLVFAGAGDPTFTNETLAKLVHRLAANGITRVRGDLIVNAGYFGPLECVPEDRCEAKLASHNSYDSALSSAAINFSNTAVAVIPAPQAGSTAEVRQAPYALPMFTLDNAVATTRHGYTSIYLSRSTGKNQGALSISGHIPVNAGTQRYYVAVGHPNRYAGEMVRAFLAAAGIQVDGQLRVRWEWPPNGAELAAVKSQPLWIQLRRMLVWSNNFVADTLALDLLRVRTSPPLSLSTAGVMLTRYGRKREARSDLMREHKPRLHLASGSGLTASSRASARDLVALLDTMYHNSALFPCFLGALTVPAHTPVGMLKDAKNQAWMRRLAVKSGSFHGSFKVFALAGYLRLPGGGWGAFAALVNGTKKHQPTVPTAITATRAAITPFLRP